MKKVSKKIENFYFDTVSKFIVMPLGIKIITGCLFLIGTLFILVPIIPGGYYAFDQVVITGLQSWEFGIAPVSIAIGVYALYSCNLFLKQKRYAPLCLFTTIAAFCLGVMGMEALVKGYISNFAEGIGACVFMILIAMCYLHGNPNARVWFEN